jgi:signal transduction histidine kinase
VKRLSFLFLLLIHSALFAQVDTGALQRVYYRAIHLSENKVDSIRYYADLVGHANANGAWPPAAVMSLRMYGFYYESKGYFTRALDYYYEALAGARKEGNIERQTELLTDLAAVYTQDTKQPQKAKDLYVECVRLYKKMGDGHSLLNSYVNLSAIYNHLGLHDSALILLQEGLRIGRPYELRGEEDLTSLYNNLGNTYYHLKRYNESVAYFKYNYKNNLAGHAPSRLSDVWLDVLNLADAYTEKGVFDSAARYGDTALLLARQLDDSKSKQSDSYQILSKLEQRKGDFKKAWDYQAKWYALDTALMNRETYKAVAELEEKYEARQHENERLVLQAEIAQQKFHSRIMMITAGSLLLIAIATAIAFIIKRKANQKLQSTNALIVRQNERLSELNYEKNSLISIVSHDLSTPFASIGMWQQLLQNEKDNLTPSQKKALDRIGQATHYGEKLIRHILDVEKAETNQNKIQLENLDLRIFAESVLDDFVPAAAQKDIQLHLDCPNRSLYFLSDRQLLSRMLENLLSNAIKYTSSGKNVWISMSEEKDAISIKVRDEGVGIQPDELPHLFAKYSKISSKPTAGEASTGLGLAIVKRICEELNGQISCESYLGKGSVFTVVLKK